MNEHKKIREVKKPEPKFRPDYKPEEDVDGKMKKFIIKKPSDIS